MSLLHVLGKKPIIAALRDMNDLPLALESQVDNIFFMCGRMNEMEKAVRSTHGKGKRAFVHIDLIKGLSNSDREVVEFIADIHADGIITPKSHLVKEAKKVGIYGILHFFVLDSLTIHKGLRILEDIQPDGIEIMPGVIPKVIETFSARAENTPIIASGLISSKSEVETSLQAGATSLSVSEQMLWDLTFDKLFQTTDN
ncbi:glycerol-3-phosphate responsive antiterminator [Evansella tamaricis]|uniref:Glycerol uptake operon antiterminator regulatory protein n=1 Tax=Evansella tamaricis TaxID=2069301 RepID=A0ABS6JAY2_9BACI|nr:glycerol-3-phosphate responsive antiterminator [Evansella tamaricis]MBU9710673.1 glycerol-3-phosphate responsive antiterminator [Evansella tamaricis]